MRPAPRLRRLLAAVCAVALAALAIAPSAGMAQVAPNNISLPTLGDSAREDLSPVFERKLGEEIMRDIRRDRDFLDDDAILEYLNNFGSDLVAAYPGARGETGADFYFLRCARPDAQCVRAAGRLHRGPLGAADRRAERIRTGLGAVARDRPRHPAPHRAHDRPAETGCADAAGGDGPRRAGRRRRVRGRGNGRVDGRAGAGDPAPAQFQPRRRARGRPGRLPDHGRRPASTPPAWWRSSSACRRPPRSTPT